MQIDPDEALDYHSSAPAGKVAVVPTKSCRTQRDLSLVDILPVGCSKGAALLRLAAERGIRPAEMMAIGDNWNDLSMLEIAGRAVLMENAPTELKALAVERGWVVGGHHDRNGVALAIAEVLGRNGSRVGSRAVVA